MKISKLFRPPGDEGFHAFKDVLPSFFLVTLVMFAVYIQTIATSAKLDHIPLLIGFTLLMAIHLIIYWMVFSFIATDKGIFIYMFIQGGLAFTMVMISQSETLTIAMYAALTGNLVGILGNRKVTIFVVFFYLTLAAINLLLISDIEAIRQWGVVIIPAVLFSGFLAFLFNRQIESRAKADNLLEELEETHRQLAEYAVKVEDLTRSTERQRMARELHDTLAQGLAGLILQLEAANTHINEERPARAQEIIRQAMTRARDTLAGARQAINDLRVDEDDRTDLVTSIKEEANRFSRSTGISYDIHVDETTNLSAEKREHLFRIVTESLNNIAQHAQATKATIQIKNKNDQLVLTITDNGTGFDQEKVSRELGHYGIVGMRERARLVGGSFTIDSQAEEGTTILVSAPLDDPPFEEEADQ